MLLNAVKIDPKERKIVIDEEIEDQLLDDLQYELPDQSPRYVLYQFTHTHPDGRKSVPLVFIFLSPAGMAIGELSLAHPQLPPKVKFSIHSFECCL
jgi:hypothetical protein